MYTPDQKNTQSTKEQGGFEKAKQDLLILLKQHNIPFEDWGKGSAKTLDHLVKEVMGGEAILEIEESGELIRKVSITYIDVYYTDPTTGNRLKLVEKKQIFKDGRERRRTLEGSMAEKIKAGETPNQEMINRAIQEELGITGEIPTTSKGTGGIRQDSPSFPGLTMQATHYLFEVELNTSQYNPDGYIENQSDKSTYFKWVSA
ncbi:MAG: hypothetical protein HZA36_03415 [Parcubacteria group bacterium]|nr:hypothetical protein [Parcubacteria group bacterium]